MSSWRVLFTVVLVCVFSHSALAHNGETPRLPRRGGGPDGPGGKGAGTPSAIPNPPNPIRWDRWLGPNLDRILYSDLRRARARAAVPTEESREASPKTIGARDRIIVALLEYLQAGDRHERAAAVFALARARSSKALPYLLDLLEPDEEGRIPGGPLGILDVGMAGSGSPTACRVLLAILGNRERSWEERTFAAFALGLMRARQAAPRLLAAALSEDEYIEDRCTCILALGLMGDDVMLPEVALFLTAKKWGGDEHCMLRAAAALALPKLGHRGAIPGLLKALDDPIRDVRRQAALSLGVLAQPGDDRVVTALLNLLAVGDERPLRAYAAVALGEIGRPDTANPLYRIYLEGDKALGPYALLGLACVLRGSEDEGHRSRFLTPLRRTLQSEQIASRRAAIIIALGIARDREVGGLLVEILESDEAIEKRTHAAQLLGGLGKGEHAAALWRVALDTGQPGLSRAAARSLGLIGDHVFTKHLTEELKSAPGRLARGRAARLLGEILHPETAGPLLGALADEEEHVSVRNRAAEALGRILKRHGEPLPSVHPLNPHLPLPAINKLADHL